MVRKHVWIVEVYTSNDAWEPMSYYSPMGSAFRTRKSAEQFKKLRKQNNPKRRFRVRKYVPEG